jgi:hypothetical protein
MSTSIIAARHKQLAELEALQEIVVKERARVLTGMEDIRDRISGESQAILETSVGLVRQKRGRYWDKTAFCMDRELVLAKARLAAADEEMEKIKAEVEGWRECLK